MAKFKIIPKKEFVEDIEATSKEEAMDKFVMAMDTDMNAYFDIIEVAD